jgi:acyl-CoA thioesterase-1
MKQIMTFITLFMVSGTVLWGNEKTVVFIGDSLTEGYGVDKENSYPSLVQKEVSRLGLKYKIVNGGVSGSTTASGISRLKWFLKLKPSVLFLALGANDGLRGIKLSETRKNLISIIELAKKNNLKVILGGMRIPTNYGKAYTKKFKSMYPELATKYKLGLVPFLLKGVAGVPKLNLEDGIHPNKEGYKLVSKNVMAVLKDYL